MKKSDSIHRRSVSGFEINSVSREMWNAEPVTKNRPEACERAAGEFPAKPSFPSRKILIIEDEADILLLIKQRLEKAGYEVITASSGSEGLDQARRTMPDLIILDLMLPGINGYQICAILKHDRRYMKIPILILTARADPKDYELGMKVGADAYLTKPIDHETLLAKLEELLAKCQSKA